MGRELERESLKGVYKNSRAWVLKVNRWSDAQVLAVYLRFKKQNVI